MAGPMKTPNQEVAERIVAALLKEDILIEKSTVGLAEKLASGRMGSTDWVTSLLMDSLTRKQNEKDQASGA